MLEESAFTDAEMAEYDRFGDILSTEKTFYNSALRKGLAEGTLIY